MGMRFFQCELNIMLWTGIDADSKLIVSWLVGGRDGQYAMEFMDDVAKRLANRVQLSRIIFRGAHYLPGAFSISFDGHAILSV